VRSALIITLGLLTAAVCIRLGLWQLDRRTQRQAYNAEATARLANTPIPLREVRGDSAAVRLQRVTASGTWQYADEVALTARSRNGSPGVHILTPLRLADSDTLVLVARGWVYAADAATVDFPRWQEGDSAQFEGFVLPFPRPAETPDTSQIAPRAVTRLDAPRLAARLGAPLAPYYVVLTASSAADTGEVPVRLTEPPVTDEGQHLSYAVQWFLFATIFGAGSVVVALRGGPGTTRRAA
jgi:surfeit locus 1 family protein